MPKYIQFYDVKTKKKFKTDEYDIERSGNRISATARTPSGGRSFKYVKESDIE